MLKNFRKFHRHIGVVACAPLLLTAISGTLATLAHEWDLKFIPYSLLMRLHTGELFHLAKFYPILNGMGLLALIITGVTMIKRRRSVRPVPLD